MMEWFVLAMAVLVVIGTLYTIVCFYKESKREWGENP